MMQRGGEKRHSDQHDPDALKDAQRTRLESQTVLRVQRVGHEARTYEEPGDIGEAADFQWITA